jgi:hypothetical protein
VLHEETMQMTRTNPHTGGELVHRTVIETAFIDESQRSPNDNGSAQPGRSAGRSLGPTSQARSKTGFGGSRG